MVNPLRHRQLAAAMAIGQQSGVALAILVWFLAAMSLLVGGIVMQARVDIKLAQLHATRARVEAAADGGIQLVIADMLVSERQGEFDQRTIYYGQRSVGNLEVAVSLTPLGGLIDLNLASEELLLALFLSIAEMPENVAEELTLSVIEWRSASQDEDNTGDSEALETVLDATGAGKIRHGRFEAIEDLLLVPGIDRQLFDAVRDSVYVSQEGQAGIDWVSAPVSVLRVIGENEEDGAMEVAAFRRDERSDELEAPDSLDLSFQESSYTPSYRVDALVKADDTVYRRRRWLNRSQPGADGLPWSFFRSEPIIVASAMEAAGIAMPEGLNAGI